MSEHTTDVELLEHIQALLSEEAHWTQGTEARNSKTGKHVSPRGRLADQFCLSGALNA